MNENSLNWVGRPIPFTFVKCSWCKGAETGLRDTFYGNMESVRDGVRSGKMELFRVNGDSWLVTEIMGGMLFIWCYQGRGLVQMVDRLRMLAKHNGMQCVSFYTPHKAALRALRRFDPRPLSVSAEGHIQYEIDCASARVDSIENRA